jgi:hypothetical protein
MQDYAAFCRQRLRACFCRRRCYPFGSDERRHAVEEARTFLLGCRAELARQEAELVAGVLEIVAPPASASLDECRQWIAWWKPSYEAARLLPDGQKAYLKGGGWWPPLGASMIGIAPEIVRRTSRPGLHADERQPDK